MTFAVVWMPPALDQLAEIWVRANDQNAVTTASQRLDLLLARNPLAVGESRGGADRIVFDAPLRILYRIVLDDLRVEVIDVGTT